MRRQENGEYGNLLRLRVSLKCWLIEISGVES